MLVIAVIFLLLLWPTTIPNMRALVNTLLTGEPAFQPFPQEAELELERVLKLETTGEITWMIELSKPYHNPGIHELKSLTTNPNPDWEYVYKGQDWMEWNGTTPNTNWLVQIRLVYKMHLYSTVWDIDASDSAHVADIPSDYNKYLGTEWKITPNDPQVQALSAEIVDGETNVYKILLKIYKWMDDNLEYKTQRQAEPKSCSATLSSGEGDCDDQSILLASLARAAGVPVWLNLGIIYDPVRNYWGGHGWNNVFIPMKEGKDVIATVDIVNNQFLFRDPYHISDYIDNGDGDDLQDYYTSWSYSFNGPKPYVDSEEIYNILDLKTRGSVVYTAP